MENAALLLDSLNSIASLVAIVAALVAWYISARKALTIERVVIHRKANDSNYIMIVRNRKNYPVTIKSSRCYTRKKFTVTKYRGEKAELTEGFPLENQVFLSNEDYIIEAKGNTDVKINGTKLQDSVKSLIFSLNTSHGFHEIVHNGEILVVDMAGNAMVRNIELQRSYQSRFKARARFFALKIFRH